MHVELSSPRFVVLAAHRAIDQNGQHVAAEATTELHDRLEAIRDHSDKLIQTYARPVQNVVVPLLNGHNDYPTFLRWDTQDTPLVDIQGRQFMLYVVRYGMQTNGTQHTGYAKTEVRILTPGTAGVEELHYPAEGEHPLTPGTAGLPWVTRKRGEAVLTIKPQEILDPQTNRIHDLKGAEEAGRVLVFVENLLKSAI